MGIHTCIYCGKEFRAKQGAITCSPKCRVALSMQRKRLRMRRIEALPPQAIDQLDVINQYSQRAYRRIVGYIELRGAQYAEPMIYAAYEAITDTRISNLFN